MGGKCYWGRSSGKGARAGRGAGNSGRSRVEELGELPHRDQNGKLDSKGVALRCSREALYATAMSLEETLFPPACDSTLRVQPASKQRLVH